MTVIYMRHSVKTFKNTKTAHDQKTFADLKKLADTAILLTFAFGSKRRLNA